MTKELDFKNYLNRVFTWMAFGLTASAITGYIAFQNIISKGFMYKMFANPIFFYGIAIAEIVMVLVISIGIRKLSAQVSRMLFVLYSVINGLTFSILPLAYGVSNIFMAFGAAAILFIVMVIIGKTTKADLTKFGGWMLILLITFVILGLINAFMKNPMIDLVMPYIGVVIFMALTAYDIQKIKKNYQIFSNDEEMKDKMVVQGALNLYLDFVNIFIDLLKILSRD